jgi:cytochrome b561
MHPINPQFKTVRSSGSVAAWRYGNTAIFLHWLLAVLITVTAAIGWIMMAIEKEPGSIWYFNLHKSIGLVIALMAALRLLWRIRHRPQGLPQSVPRWQARLSTLTQALLYLLMLLIPLIGYLGAAHSKSGVIWFGVTTPRWAVANHDLAEQFFDIHSLLVWVLVGALTLHVLGALKHRLVDRDGVFERVWFKPRS